MSIGNLLIQIGLSLGGTVESLPPAPEHRREISSANLRRVLRAEFPEGSIHLSDQAFFMPDIEDIELFLDQDETNRFKYLEEEYDCDDFAKRLFGQFAIPGWSHFSQGLLWTNTHAMFVCVDANEEVWLIEPQTDIRRSNLEEWQGASVRFIVM